MRRRPAGEHFGAEVTGVCDTKHVELVRSLGADVVIDYTAEDFRRNGVEYDVIFDAVGKQRFTHCKKSLKPGGVYLPTDGWGNFAMAFVTRLFGDRKVRVAIPPCYEKEHVRLVRQLIEAGEYRAVIDRTYPSKMSMRPRNTSRRDRRRGTLCSASTGKRREE